MPAEDRPPPRGTHITSTTPKSNGKGEAEGNSEHLQLSFPPAALTVFLHPLQAQGEALPPARHRGRGSAAAPRGSGVAGGARGGRRERRALPSAAGLPGAFMAGRCMRRRGRGRAGERCPPPPAHSPGPPAAQVRSPRRGGRGTANSGNEG